MSEVQAAPKLQKWPFYLADLVLSGIGAFVLTRIGVFQNATHVVIAVGCLLAAGWGAWISIMPWLIEYRTRSSLAENANLRSTLEQIQSLEKLGELIRQSNSQWQGVQDASGRTVTAAREIAEKMKVETEEFMKFIDNAHDQERAGLRLEVDKLRKMEGDWIKVTVQILDHVFALCRAAEKSGQEHLIQQLSHFQAACRDVARRMGLTPYTPTAGEKYDPRGHQLPDPPSVIDENALVGDVLATGYTYQGQLLRRSLVVLKEVDEPEPAGKRSSEEIPSEQTSSDREEVPMFADDHPEAPERLEATVETNSPEGPQGTRQGRQPRPDPQNELPLV